MKSADRFMNELFRIVSGALKLDLDKVRNYTQFLADKLEKDGDIGSADRLRKMLVENDHTLRPAGSSAARALPVDSESRFPLVERVTPDHVDSPLILSPDSWSLVSEFLSVAKSHAQLEAQGVSTPLSLMLYGPPGVGKSRLARFLASELGLDLYIARLDGLISSYLGSTSKNIRALFEFASRTPCVLFLDEFDAIAKLRGDEQEVGELKRVVNTFLQNLDSLGPQTIVVAATNHEELLDRAVWRRFSYRLELGYPSFSERGALWNAFLKGLEYSPRTHSLLADLSDGFSGSEIEEVARRLLRKRITEGAKPDLSYAFRVLRQLADGTNDQERRFLASLSSSADTEIAMALRERDPNLYSLAAIGRLLGVSKTTAFRLVETGATLHD